jgi:hypothetical protein
MRSLLGLLLCFGLCAFLAVGTTGCKKSEKKKDGADKTKGTGATDKGKSGPAETEKVGTGEKDKGGSADKDKKDDAGKKDAGKTDAGKTDKKDKKQSRLNNSTESILHRIAARFRPAECECRLSLVGMRGGRSAA